MREIKFRTWIPDPFASEPYMATQGNSDIETLQSFMHHYSDEPILMQFTGLKDKNGKDIYEGDILKVPEHYPASGGKWTDQIAKVLFEDGSFVLRSNNGFYSILKPHAEKSTITGNIYQNP